MTPDDITTVTPESRRYCLDKDFPHSVRMRLGWGASCYLSGKYPEAAQTLLKAAEIAPNPSEVILDQRFAILVAAPGQNHSDN